MQYLLDRCFTNIRKTEIHHLGFKITDTDQLIYSNHDECLAGVPFYYLTELEDTLNVHTFR